MTTAELELAMRDSFALENCKTVRELQYTIRNIEARHAVEGIHPHDAAAYRNVKRQHMIRVTVTGNCEA